MGATSSACALTWASSCRVASAERILRPDRQLEPCVRTRTHRRWAAANGPSASAASTRRGRDPDPAARSPRAPTGARHEPRLDKVFWAGASEEAAHRAPSRSRSNGPVSASCRALVSGALRSAEGVGDETPLQTGYPQEYAAHEYASPPVSAVARSRRTFGGRSCRSRTVDLPSTSSALPRSSIRHFGRSECTPSESSRGTMPVETR